MHICKWANPSIGGRGLSARGPWALTVDDVAYAGETHGWQAYAQQVQQWTAEVWKAWERDHRVVGELTSKLQLRRGS